jgi:hypothetical protein
VIRYTYDFVAVLVCLSKLHRALKFWATHKDLIKITLELLDWSCYTSHLPIKERGGVAKTKWSDIELITISIYHASFDVPGRCILFSDDTELRFTFNMDTDLWLLKDILEFCQTVQKVASL